MPRHLALTFTLACALAASACVPMLPTGVEGKKKDRGSREEVATDAKPTTTENDKQKAPASFTGRVLGLDGQMAAGVSVKAYVISAGSGNVISAGSGNVISAGSGNVISAGSGNVISAGSGNYRIQQAPTEVKTDAEGRFTLDFPADAKLNIEAVQADTVKAIRMAVTGSSSDISLQLAKTGTISGKVTAPEAPSVTNFEGVDVFIPGTGYIAKADAAGTFTIPNVPVGTFDLVASKNGLGRANLIGVAVASEKTTTTADLALTVKAPSVATITPSLASAGMEVTLTGENFGATDGKTFHVTFGGVIAESPTRVDDTTIKVKVPASAGNGSVAVAVDGISSNGASLTVVKALTVAGPDALIRGRTVPYTVSGTDSAGNAVAAPPVSWTVEGAHLSVDATGKVTSSGLGAGKVIATFGGVSQSLPVTVVDSRYTVSTFLTQPSRTSKTPDAAVVDYTRLDGLAVDPQDNLILLDNPGRKIFKISPAKTVSSISYTMPEGLNFDDVRAIALDGDGNVLALDGRMGRIFKITPQGVTSVFAGTGDTFSRDGDRETGAFYAPLDMIMGKDGFLYVCEDDQVENAGANARRSIRKVAMDGTISTLGPITWPAEAEPLAEFTNLAQDPQSGTLWATEYATPSQAAMQLTALFTLPTSLTASRTAGLISIDAPFAPTDGTGPEACLTYIADMVVNARGAAFVTEIGTTSGSAQVKLVRRISPAGVVKTIAGAGSGYEEGLGTSARFGTVDKMAIDSQGHLYVADDGMVRKITVEEAL